MEFYDVLDQVLELLKQRGRASYRALKAQFHLDDDLLETLKEEIIEVHQVAVDQDGKMLVWTTYREFKRHLSAGPSEAPNESVSQNSFEGRGVSPGLPILSLFLLLSHPIWQRLRQLLWDLVLGCSRLLLPRGA